MSSTNDLSLMVIVLNFLRNNETVSRFYCSFYLRPPKMAVEFNPLIQRVGKCTHKKIIDLDLFLIFLDPQMIKIFRPKFRQKNRDV